MAQVQAYLEAKASETEALRGKKGVKEARARLAKLQQAHDRIQTNLHKDDIKRPVLTPTERRLLRLARFVRYPVTEEDLVSNKVEQLIERRHHHRAAEKLGIAKYARYDEKVGDFIPMEPWYLKSVLDLGPKSGGYARLGEWFITLQQDETVDWNYYPRSYRFPKVTVSNRRVVVARRVNKYQVERHEVPVDSWRGNVVLQALIKLGIAKETRYTKLLRAAQGHPAFELVHRRTLGTRYDLYQRTLGGHHIDYVVVDHQAQLAQHGESLKGIMRELQLKLEALGKGPVDGSGVVTYSLVKSLGFCTAGIKEFCQETGLRFAEDARYNLDYILKKYQGLPSYQRQAYRREIDILVRAVGGDTQAAAA